MDFNFTQEQQLLQRTLAEFGSRELAPAYASRDKDDDLPREVVSQLARMGLLAPMAEARFGGNDLDYVSIGIAHEEIARYDFNAAYVLLLSGRSVRLSRRAPTNVRKARSSRQYAAARP